MRKIKHISLALTLTPLLFMGCMQEKVSRIIPSKSTDNHTPTVISKTDNSRIDNSLKAKDSSNQIISESELDKLVALVQKKLASEAIQQTTPKLPIITSIPLAETENIYDSDLLEYEYDFEPVNSNLKELDELTQMVANGLDTEIRGIEGIYSTAIILNDDIIKEEAQTIVEEVTKENEIISTAIAFLDIPYIWAANGPTSFDCSGFTKYVFKEHGLTIPRYSGHQAKVGTTIAYDELQVGDLVFFDTDKKYKKKVNHVGIYMGDNRFIHASSAKKKVIITSFKKKRFYKKRFLWGQRVIKDNSIYASL